MEQNETKRFPYFKVFLGLLAVVAIVIGAMAVEKTISSSVKDVVIDKSTLSTDKVSFIKVKPLDTRIMAVIAEDGTVRLAFDECLSCYYNDGVKGNFEDSGESVVCDQCGCETFYEDMGLLSDECTPIPILSDYITEDETTITIPKAFLESCKEMLDVLRSGKGNYATVYGQSDFMNMEITEASDAAVQFDNDGENIAPASEVTVDDLLNRTENITKLYNGYLNDVTINASQSDIGAYSACYKEFLVLCDELAETEVTKDRAAQINKKFDEIEAKLREIGQSSAK
ncbi:MAG: Fe-S-containing protein [Clostridia bacterium]